jgi:alanyl-tRNA synthetase
LLHRALRQVVGEHAAQSGSYVSPDRLRFDFSHLAGLSPDELLAVERIVNEQVRANRPVTTTEMGYDEARKQGVIALFGEKYGDRVRVVRVEGFSAELCGGTHLHTTGQVGSFIVTGESSIGSGLRRIEAVTGRGADAYRRHQADVLAEVGRRLAAREDEVTAKLDALLAQAREQRRAIQSLQAQLAAQGLEGLLSWVRPVEGMPTLAAPAPVHDVDALRDLADRLRDRLRSGVVALGALINGRPILLVALTADAVEKGLNAGKIAGAAARVMGGGGGGRPDMAQAGGRDPHQLPQALEAVYDLVAEALVAGPAVRAGN